MGWWRRLLRLRRDLSTRFFNVYAMRVNLSVAVVKMQHEYTWSDATKGHVLGAFFYGYICTQVLGGWLASRFGGKHVFGCGVLVTAVLTLATPWAADTSLAALLAVRFVEGVGEGVTFPAMHALWARWAPPQERSTLTSLGYSGGYFGTVVAFPISGWLCGTSLWGGWPAVFYVFGLTGLAWYVLWLLLVASSPDAHPYISVAEREYITSSITGATTVAPGTDAGASALPPPNDATPRVDLDAMAVGVARAASPPHHVVAARDRCHTRTVPCTGPADNLSPPWASIAVSGPVWCIICAHVVHNFGYYMLLTCLPTYMSDVLNFDVQSSGAASTFPYFTLWVATIAAGRLADCLQSRRSLSTVAVRKSFTVAAFLGAATFLLLAGFNPASGALSHVLVTAFLSAAMGCLALGMPSWWVNHMDLSPRYAGVLMGVTNTAATIPGFVTPSMVSAIATAPKSDLDTLRDQWRTVFVIAAVAYLFGAVVYACGASASRQPWADRKSVGCCNPSKRRLSGQDEDAVLLVPVRADVPPGSGGVLSGSVTSATGLRERDRQGPVLHPGAAVTSV